VTLVITNSGLPACSVDIYTLRMNLCDYDPGNPIDGGACGEVFQTVLAATRDFVVYKDIFWRNDGDPLAIQRVYREIAIPTWIHHPAILPVIGWDEGPDRFVLKRLILPYMSNGSLEHYLFPRKNPGSTPAPKTHPLTFYQQFLIIYGIACGMLQLHKHRVIHRDLAPANILLNAFLEPKITDFGFAKVTPGGASLQQSINPGRSCYKAPEMLDGDGFSFPADVYSFAMVMYTILLKTVPFASLGPQVHQKTINVTALVTEGVKPEFPKDFTGPLREIIENCWKQGPEDRLTFPEIVKQLGTERFLNLLPHSSRSQFREYQCRVAPPELIMSAVEIRRLGLLSDPGLNVSSTFSEAVTEKVETKESPIPEKLRSAVDAKDMDALALIGAGIENGHYPGSKAEAIRYYERAAALRHPNASFMLESARILGSHNDRDEKLDLLKREAAAGDGLSANLCGEILVHKNMGEALGYFKLSVEEGCPEGMFNLGTFYQNGPDRDIKKAVDLYQRSASLGVSRAFYALADLYRWGAEGIEANAARAAGIAKMNALRGEFLGLVQCSDFFCHGIGVQEDQGRAAEFLRKAEDNACVRDQEYFLWMLEHEYGCHRNANLAAKIRDILNRHFM
jgi:serine/threonine protein kinase